MSVNAYLPPSPVLPMFLNITSITNANPCQVTTDTSNSYMTGQLVRFSVPSDYGMFQINGLTGEIVAIDITNLIFKVAINTTQFDVFTSPTGLAQPATLSPAGSRNLYNVNQVPFHSEDGNVGN